MRMQPPSEQAILKLPQSVFLNCSSLSLPLLMITGLTFLSISRVLPILRVLRALRSLRSISALRGLQIVVQTVIHSIPGVLL